MKVGISLPVSELGHDLVSVRDFAQQADELGFSHLRVPDSVIRPAGTPLPEPLMLLAYLAGITQAIDLVPSVVIAPARPTALLAKQVAELDRLSGHRVRLGVGVGANPAEYQALGQDFGTRGARLSEQIIFMRRLWTEESVTFHGRWDQCENVTLHPRPPGAIPIWIGASRHLSDPVIERIASLADGWFVLVGPDDYQPIKSKIDEQARRSGREPDTIATEASVSIVDPRLEPWLGRVERWEAEGLTSLNLRTLGAELNPEGHLTAMKQAAAVLELTTGGWR